MKKIFLIAIFTIVFCFGCSEWTPEQKIAWQNYWNNYALQQQNLTYQQNMQLRENGRYINQQLQRPSNSSYWQEKAAQQQYWQNYNK